MTRADEDDVDCFVVVVFSVAVVVNIILAITAGVCVAVAIVIEENQAPAAPEKRIWLRETKLGSTGPEATKAAWALGAGP